MPGDMATQFSDEDSMPAPRAGSLRRLTLVAVGAVLLSVALWLDPEFFTLATLQQHHADLVAMFEARPAVSLAVFALVLVTLVSFSVPGVLIFMLFAGSVFKLWFAVLFIVVCRTIGAIAAFLLGRHLARAWVKRRFSGMISVIDRGVDREGWLYLAMLRLAPILPDSVINPGMGLTSVRLWTFAWVSAVGMIPYVTLYAAAGQQLGKLESTRDLVDPQWLVLLSALAGLLFLGKRLVARLGLLTP